MMSVEYMVVNFDDLSEEMFGAAKTEYLGLESWYVVRCEGGKQVEIIGQDGGEPEDQTLVRDWSWVSGELNRAYNLGYETRRQDEVDGNCDPEQKE